jgi:hypothetical protein
MPAGLTVFLRLFAIVASAISVLAVLIHAVKPVAASLHGGNRVY